MACGRVRNLLSAYLDRELCGDEMLSVRRHLGDCLDCRAEHDGLTRVRRILHALPAAEPRRGAEDRVIRSLKGMGDPKAQGRLLCSWWRGLVGRRTRTPEEQPLPRYGPWTALAQLAPVAGVVCASLVLAWILAGIRQPQHPDAVMAMVRPQVGIVESHGHFFVRPAHPAWDRVGLYAPAPRAGADFRRTGGIALLEQERSWTPGPWSHAFTGAEDPAPDSRRILPEE